MRFALVPAKPLDQAKQRLAPVLSATERRRLSLAMLEDVLVALLDASCVDDVAVVTADRDLLDLARRIGADPIDEVVAKGLNAAVTRGIDHCVARGASAVFTVLSDLPELTSTEVESFFAAGDETRLALTRSHDGVGTNGVLVSPPAALAASFGGASFARHAEAAERAGLRLQEIVAPGVRFDVDTPEDLLQLRRSERPSRAALELRRMRPAVGNALEV